MKYHREAKKFLKKLDEDRRKFVLSKSREITSLMK